jgi:hypothetical protein
VDNGAILDIRPPPDPDTVDVSAQHRVEPDTRLFPDFNITDDPGPFGDIRRGMDRR